MPNSNAKNSNFRKKNSREMFDAVELLKNPLE